MDAENCRKILFTSLALKTFLANFHISESIRVFIVLKQFLWPHRLPKEFQKAVDIALQKIKSVICFLIDIVIVSKRSIEDLNEIV